MSIFFTSDTHFGHDKDFLWKPRGFSSIQEHDEMIIQRWNENVKPEDTVYHLGDVMLGDNKHGIDCLHRLNGHIILLPGNHDTDTRKRLYVQEFPNVVFNFDTYATMLKVNGKRSFYLSHFPTMLTNGEENHGPWGLCGHTHTTDKYLNMNMRAYHVELDAHNCCPVSLDTILTDIKNYKGV